MSTAPLKWKAMKLVEKRKRSASMEPRKKRKRSASMKLWKKGKRSTAMKSWKRGKKSAAMDGGHQSSIFLLPGEIVAEILRRLRIELIFRCNCVSKQWNSFISDPNVKQLVAPDPGNGELFWCLYARDNRGAYAIDVQSAKEDIVDLSDVTVPDGMPIPQAWPVVPVALSPWSSPFYAQAWKQASSLVGCREMFHVRFPPP